MDRAHRRHRRLQSNCRVVRNDRALRPCAIDRHGIGDVHSNATTSPPVASSPAWASVLRCAVRPQMTTLAPAFANPPAMPRPRSALPPVTSATCFDRSNNSVHPGFEFRLRTSYPAAWASAPPIKPNLRRWDRSGLVVVLRTTQSCRRSFEYTLDRAAGAGTTVSLARHICIRDAINWMNGQ